MEKGSRIGESASGRIGVSDVGVNEGNVCSRRRADDSEPKAFNTVTVNLTCYESFALVCQARSGREVQGLYTFSAGGSTRYIADRTPLSGDR